MSWWQYRYCHIPDCHTGTDAWRHDDSTGTVIFLDYHTGTNVFGRDDSTGTVIFWITIPELTSYIVMTVPVLLIGT